MNLLLPAVRVILLAVFAIAGVAKVRNLPGMARTLADFGVPDRWTRPVAAVLAGGELVVALGLLFADSAQYAAGAAFALLTLFLVGISYNLARGRKPACNCFGEISAKPIGSSTLVRNLVLAAGAGVVAKAGAGPELTVWAVHVASGRSLQLLVGALASAMLLQAYLTIEVLRQQGRMLQRLDAMAAGAPVPTHEAEAVASARGLGTGTLAPQFALPNLSGGTVDSGTLLAAGRSLLLVFMNPQCGPCDALLPEVAAWMADPPPGAEVLVISEGSAEENLAKGAELNPLRVLLQEQREIADAYHAWGTPSAVLVDPDGRIGSSVAQGAATIRELVAAIGGRVAPQDVPTARQPDPSFALS